MTLEVTLGYLLTEGYLTGELTLDDGTGRECHVKNQATYKTCFETAV